MAVQTAVTPEMVKEANKMAETIAPEMMPSVLVNACIGKKPQVAGVPDEMVTDQAPSAESSTAKGLILSEENIISIERYKNFGLSLPVTETDVKNALKYDDDFDAVKHAVIAPAAFVALNQTIKGHCMRWTGLRNEIIMLGVSLNIFSKKFIAIGSDISMVIRNMPVVTRALTSLDAFDQEFEWGEDDHVLKGAAIELIEELKRQVGIQQDKTHALVTKLEDFRSDMESKVVPGVSQMNTALLDMEHSDERAKLLARQEELRKEIASLDKQYNQMVGYAFTGAAGMLLFPVGVLTWAITGGIFGDKAEKVRKKRNDRQKERDALTKQLAAEEHLAAFVSRTHDEVVKQALIIDEALVGVKNLEVMWGAIARYIDDSAEELAAIDKAQKLILFVRHLDSAVDSWREVQDITGELNLLFTRAEEKAKKMGYISQKEVEDIGDAVADGTADGHAPVEELPKE